MPSQQQIPPQRQQMPPQQQQQMPPPQQQQIYQQKQMYVEEDIYEEPVFKRKKQVKKYIEMPTVKTSALVTVIFILLNSKIVWKQIIKLPMMGVVEPSIMALIVNSVLAGVVFYIINGYLSKNER
jgi:hypothetical protein